MIKIDAMIGLFPPGNYYAGATGAPVIDNRYINVSTPEAQAIADRFISHYTPIENEKTGMHTAGLYYLDGKLSGMQTIGKTEAIQAFTGNMQPGGAERLWERLGPYIQNTPNAITGPSIMSPDEQERKEIENYNKTNLYILLGGFAAAAIIILSKKKRKRR